MWSRIIGLTLLVVGAVVLFTTEAIWARAIGGSAFIFGFLVFALDLMRRSFLKDEMKK